MSSILDLLEKTAPDQDHKNVITIMRRADDIHDAVFEITKTYAVISDKSVTPEKREAALKCLNEMLNTANAFLSK